MGIVGVGGVVMLRSQFQGEAEEEVTSNPTPVVVAPSPTATPVPIPTHTPTSEPTAFPTQVVLPTAAVINSSGENAAVVKKKQSFSINIPPCRCGTEDATGEINPPTTNPPPSDDTLTPPLTGQSGGVLSTGNGIFWALAGIVTLLLMAFGVFNHQQRSH